MPERRRVETGSRWAEVVGYSRAVRVGNLIHVSGTAPVGVDGGIAHRGDAYGQARRCLEIIVASLRELGAGPEHVVRTRMYVREGVPWEEVGRAHGEILAGVKPATTMVFTTYIDPDILLENEADAVV